MAERAWDKLSAAIFDMPLDDRCQVVSERGKPDPYFHIAATVTCNDLTQCASSENAL